MSSENYNFSGKFHIHNDPDFCRRFTMIMRTVSAQSDKSTSIDPVFVSLYQLQLPKQGEMEAFLRKAMAELEIDGGRAGV